MTQHLCQSCFLSYDLNAPQAHCSLHVAISLPTGEGRGRALTQRMRLTRAVGSLPAAISLPTGEGRGRALTRTAGAPQGL